MSKANLIKWGGYLAAVGGVCMAAYMLIHPWNERIGEVATTLQWFTSHSFHLVGAILLVPGLFALYLRQREEIGKPGLLSFLIAYLGTALFIGTGLTSTFLWPAIAQDAPSFVAEGGGMFENPLSSGPIIAARVFLVIGFLWFGFVSFRAGILPRRGSVAVMLGTVAMNLPTPPVGPVPWVVTVIGGVVFGLGLLSWGRALWKSAPAAHEGKIALLRTEKLLLGAGAVAVILAVAVGLTHGKTVRDCAEVVQAGLLKVANDRSERFLGKVRQETASCRGGEKAEQARSRPWVDWGNYYAAADSNSQSSTWLDPLLISRLERNGRGIDGSLMDLEYQRLELIQFNLFDNSGTFPGYETGRGSPGAALRWWPEMRLPPGHPDQASVGGDGEQVCRGDNVRARTLRGICNDVFNPGMGATGALFARNVQFETTFPHLGHNEMLRNRHGDRLGLLKPDPQVISRKLFTRMQTDDEACNQGYGVPGRQGDASCDYQSASFFNVLAAFWIQFMTHDWFSHLDEGANQPDTWMEVGCPEDQAEALGCRPGDRIDPAIIAEDAPPPTFTDGKGKQRYVRAPKTTRNNVTAWWDASQIYGYDDDSLKRVKRDGSDSAKLRMDQVGDHGGEGESQGYLPLLEPDDPQQEHWRGQEAVAFPDNFNIGLSFYANVFVREHNAFVGEFRKLQKDHGDQPSGLRNPSRPEYDIPYSEVTDDELYEAARHVVSAIIAKIHTIEWTTQLLYNEPLFRGMNANWSGLFPGGSRLSDISGRIRNRMAQSSDPDKANLALSIFASGSGIVGSGNRMEDKDFVFDVSDPLLINGGVSHFGSPFNFPEEFITVYRLHPLVPDLIEFRSLAENPNAIQTKVPVVETAFAGATAAMRNGGIANWALSMGRQRLGALVLNNHPQFLQNLAISRYQSDTGKIDVAALDVIRDRERGIPRFNEFRRQYGLKQFRSFEELTKSHKDDTRGQELADTLREIYGTHTCDDSKIITASQRYIDDGTNKSKKVGELIDDCLGFANGTEVDNIEDVDAVVGWLAEAPALRPHGFAITETQFHVFIINASRRLFSDRFFTSSFRPEFYTKLGYDWVVNNGPGEKRFEPGLQNGHEVEVSPMKRVLLRTMPELSSELASVINVFDPWARDRGEYYCLDWKPRPGAETDPAFANWDDDGKLLCTDN